MTAALSLHIVRSTRPKTGHIIKKRNIMRTKTRTRDEDTEVKDGETVRTTVLLMDAAQHAIKSADADADRRQAREERDAMLRDSWRTPKRDARKKPDPDNDEDEDEDTTDRRSGSLVDARAAAASGREGYLKRLRDAWKRDHEAPLAHDDPTATMQTYLSKPAPTTTSGSDQAWQDYRTRLQEAWKIGQTNPAAATSVEGQRRGWTAER
jgi:hypothetical protein